MLIFAACAACGGGALVTATELPKESRRPDGVVLEPAPAVPDAGDRAPSRGVVSLREPLGDDAVYDVVQKYFVGFEHEDQEALATLLTSDAVSLDPRVRGGRGALLDAWKARMRSLDYKKTAGLEVTPEEKIARYAYDDLGDPGEPARPSVMESGDVLVRVPVAVPRINGERFFGDVLVMVLRREGDRYRIAAVGEEEAQ